MNKETLELPLLITKAETSPLMGLGWMQRLKVSQSLINDAKEIRNIKLDSTEKRIIKLQNNFKAVFYNNQKIKNLSVDISLKEGAQIFQQKERPIPIHLQEQVVEELKRLNRRRIPGKGN